MITGDLDAAISGALAIIAPGLEARLEARLEPRPATIGTWRSPPPPREPGSYATTIAFQLAKALDTSPATLAQGLAAALSTQPAIARAAAAGGYLTITVTPQTLAQLAVRIVAAGPDCARSQALRGTTVIAPLAADIGGAMTWAAAAGRLTAEITGRLAAVCGAELSWQPPPPASPAPAGPVADAVSFAGAAAIRFTLARMAPGQLPHIDPGEAAAQHAGNPAYAVRYAHAHAATALRQAADLGLTVADAERFRAALLAHPRERALLDVLSWFPERVAGAARRRQPHVLAAYCEDLAAGYLSCQECCPALGPGALPPGLPATAQPGSELIATRLWLAGAVRTVLGAGLSLLGIAAPGRL